MREVRSMAVAGTEPMKLSLRGALGTEDAATYTGFGRSTMKKWRSTGDGPAYVRVGAKIVYRVADLDAFLRKHLVP